MKQPAWHRWETILLVNSYYKIKNENIDYKKECSRLSNILRKNSNQTDPNYRNVSGIIMKYQNIRSIDIGAGLKHYSALDKEILELYNNNHNIFLEEYKMVVDLLKLKK